MQTHEFECNIENCPYNYICTSNDFKYYDCELYLECGSCYWVKDCYLPAFNCECSSEKRVF